MQRNLLVLFLAVALGSALHAAHVPGRQSQDVLEFAAAQQQFQQLMLAQPKTVEDIQKAREMYAERLLGLVEKYPKSPLAIDALTLIVEFDAGEANEGGMTFCKAVDILVRDHLKSNKLGQVCMALGSSAAPDAERLLRAIVDKNPSRDLQGAACYNLALCLKKQSEKVPPGDKPAEKPAKEAEDLFERVLKKHASVKSLQGKLGDLAKDELFAIRNLAIGKMAPDILGKDLDGKAFKLSDYRGKVVVLHFWSTY